MSQPDLFTGDATWVHVFRSLFLSGDAARLGPHTISVYMCIKVYVNFGTGIAFPSVDTIAEKTGISKRQVIMSLKQLEDEGYLTKDRQGKKNVYTLREKITLEQDGRPSAVATFDYIPQLVREATAELKRFKVEGEGTFNIINIEKLVIENPVVLNVQGDMNIQFDAIENAELREKLRKLFETSQARKKGA